jgi:hypothetical protein
VFCTSKCASRHNDVHFPTSQLLKMLWSCHVLCILTSKCASRHNGVRFFISDPPEPQTIEKHSDSRLVYFFVRLHLLASDSLIFSLLLFTSLPLSYLLWLFSPLLFICPYCRKFDF